MLRIERKAAPLTDGDLSKVRRTTDIDFGNLLGLAGRRQGEYLHRGRIGSEDVEVARCDSSDESALPSQGCTYSLPRMVATALSMGEVPAGTLWVYDTRVPVSLTSYSCTAMVGRTATTLPLRFPSR